MGETCVCGFGGGMVGDWQNVEKWPGNGGPMTCH